MSEVPQESQSPWRRLLWRSWMMIGVSVLLALAGWHAHTLGQANNFLQTDCLVAEIVAGLGTAFCLGGAMYYIDQALAFPMPWYWRWSLALKKRLLLAGQIASMVLMLVVVGMVLFPPRPQTPEPMRPPPRFIPRR